MDLGLTVILIPSSSTAAAGGQVSLTVTGLTPGTEYEAVLHSLPTLLGTGVADGSGVLTLGVTIPTDTPVGAHTITIAATSDPDTILASVAFTVTAGLAFTGGGTPQPWLIGAAITLFVTGAGLLVARRAVRRA